MLAKVKAALPALFAAYRTWYQARLFEGLPRGVTVDEARRDFIDYGWYEPFVLRRLSAEAIRAAETRHGRFPSSFRALLGQLGVGKIMCASDAEPHEHELVPPGRFASERRAALSWISAGGIARTKKKQKLDPSQMIPFLKVDATTWVLLARQRRDDDRVFVFDHGFEGGYDRLFCPAGETLSGFFRSYFRRSRNGDPLNAFNCWDR
jgi:hypothetical protein